MRFTFRVLLATAILAATAGVAAGQNTSSTQQPALPPLPATTPIPAIPPPPADQPSNPSTARTVEPNDASAPQTAPAVEPNAPAAQTATGRKTRLQSRAAARKMKTTKKPVESAPSEQTELKQAAPAAAGAAAVDTTGNTGGTPPSGTVESAAPSAPAVNPAPAPEIAPVETQVQRTETGKRGAVGPWIVGGLVVLGLIGVVALTMRRRSEKRLSIFDRGGSGRRPLA